MHRDLILKAFEKTKKDIRTNKSTHLAKHLSDYIFEESRETYGEKSLRTYYKKAINNSSENIEFKGYVKEALSKYLGYRDYQHFLKENPSEKNIKNSNLVAVIRKKKTTIGSIIIAVLMTYFGYDLTKKDCMAWVENSYYERLKCGEESEVKSIKYNKLIFDNLKRIDPDCNYPFFKADGSENLWYGKSAKGELEFFTYYGLHPVTGKTLDPITQYMIDKYICNR
jgi:hypothetical protein